MSVSLASQVLGEGPPLVILHGLFGSGRNWAGPAKKLAERRRVHLLDLRNHGESPWDDAMDYPTLAGDVSAYLDAQGLERADVIGHSMGGKTAMTLALSAPERVTALVVVDIAPFAHHYTLARYAEGLLALDLGGLGRRAQADAALSSAVPDPKIRAFLLQNLVNREGAFGWRINLAALLAGMEDIADFPEPLLAARYGGPTLFLGGAESDYVRPEHHARIRELFPRAEIDALAGAGHWVHADQPAAFVERVSRLLGAP